MDANVAGKKEAASPPPPQAERPRAGQDLSKEIERTIEREPQDRVRCVRVFDDYYRCNWWAPCVTAPSNAQGFDWAVATTHRVRKSSFLTATMHAGNLVMEKVKPREA